MVLSAAIGAGIAAAGSIAGGVIGSNASKSSARDQFIYQSMLQQQAANLNYTYGRKAALNSPTWNRNGLEKAGYNPMLAVQNATSGVNTNFTSPGQAGNFDQAGAISSNAEAAQNVAHLMNETMTSESTANANKATAFKTKMEGIAQGIKNKFLSTREQSEIGKIGAEVTKLTSESNLMDAQVDNLEKRLELDKYLGELGFKSSIYGADKGYQGTVYNADTLFDIADKHSPSSRSMSFKNYMDGISSVTGSIPQYLPWHRESNTYVNGNNVSNTSTTSRGRGRRKH